MARKIDTNLKERHRNIIEHSLGLTRTKKPYRQHFCTVDKDPELEAMVELGLMQRGPTINDGRDRYYYVTVDGANAVGTTLPEKN